MSLENEQDGYLKTIISVTTISVSTTIYILYRRKLLERYPVFERIVSVAWSLFCHWSRFVKSLFSLSLSTSEQSGFEENFKYLIVTSSLFNETPQQQKPKQFQVETITTSNEDKVEEDDVYEKPLTIRLFGVSALSVIISIIILTKFNSVSPWLLPCWISTYITTCYFIYKHHRHVQIRRIHASALCSMQRIVTLSQKSDSILLRLLDNFHTIECNIVEEQQQLFGTYLSTHFENYIECVHQLQPLIDSNNLSTLREMYNVKEEIPSLLLEFDSHKYNIDDIDLIYSVIGWKRREYLLYLLALDVMSNNRKNTHYGKNWRQAIKVNTGLVNEYSQFNKKLSTIENMIIDKKIDTMDEQETTEIVNSPSSSSSLLSTSPREASLLTTALSERRSSNLILRVSAVEKYMEDIQANIFLCKQDTKALSSGRVSTLSLERISKRFNHINDSFVHLLTQWEESKNALNVLLEDEQSKLSAIALLPSPPSSPRNQKSFHDDPNSISSHIMTKNEGFHLSRSKSFNGSSSSNNSVSAHRSSSFSKNRLQRIQSLKTNNRIKVEKPLPPIHTTPSSSSSDI